MTTRSPHPHRDSPRAADAAPLTRSASLGEQLSARIRAWIDSGEFAAGARLPAESDLAARFGVSRPIIREALSRLRSEGVVVSRRGSGSYVLGRDAAATAAATMSFGPLNSLAQVRKCFQFRATIEGDAAFLAAQHRSAEQLAEIRVALQKLEAAVLGRMVGISPDFEFHLAIARASGNEFFEQVMRQLQIPVEFTINLARSLSLTRTHEHMMTIQGEHVGIYEAIAAQDDEAARRRMRAHLDSACARIFDGPAPPAV
ncbi:MAG: FadR family transcriptional regulator [Pseudomonadota bacterium]|nr:FadR family transcriptional regulator [Pseudomonadota bacterium]